MNKSTPLCRTPNATWWCSSRWSTVSHQQQSDRSTSQPRHFCSITLLSSWQLSWTCQYRWKGPRSNWTRCWLTTAWLVSRRSWLCSNALSWLEASSGSWGCTSLNSKISTGRQGRLRLKGGPALKNWGSLFKAETQSNGLSVYTVRRKRSSLKWKCWKS